MFWKTVTYCNQTDKLISRVGCCFCNRYEGSHQWWRNDGVLNKIGPIRLGGHSGWWILCDAVIAKETTYGRRTTRTVWRYLLFSLKQSLRGICGWGPPHKSLVPLTVSQKKGNIKKPWLVRVVPVPVGWNIQTDGGSKWDNWSLKPKIWSIYHQKRENDARDLPGLALPLRKFKF